MYALKNLQQEITPLDKDDLFIILNRPNANFNYEPHWHTDFELNMVVGSHGERMVGDSLEKFGELDIVLIGPRLPHKWRGEVEQGNHVVTIQFQEQMLDYPTINKRIFLPIRELLDRARRGISFSSVNKPEIHDRILKLTRSKRFDTAVQFLTMLDHLAQTPNQKILASSNYQPQGIVHESQSRRIGLVCDLVNKNYGESIKLLHAAQLTNMSESAFCHFFKKKTGKNFIDYVNEVRISHATRMLFETSHTVSEICYSCGFNNTSNFIRVFKKKRGETPSEYRVNAQKMITKF